MAEDKRLGRRKEGGRALTTGPRRCWALHSKQIPGERQLGITRSPGQRYTSLHFVPGVGLWSIKGGWPSAPCSASLQSNCLFPRRLSEKKRWHLSKPAEWWPCWEGERAGVLSVEAGKENEENLEGRKRFQASKLLEQTQRDDSGLEDMLIHTPSRPLPHPQ